MNPAPRHPRTCRSPASTAPSGFPECGYVADGPKIPGAAPRRARLRPAGTQVSGGRAVPGEHGVDLGVQAASTAESKLTAFAVCAVRGLLAVSRAFGANSEDTAPPFTAVSGRYAFPLPHLAPIEATVWPISQARRRALSPTA